MTAVATFAKALADGGTVTWETTCPRVRVGSKWASELRNQPDSERAALREILHRAALFRGQIDANTGSAIIPYLSLPDAVPPRSGACISCGIEIEDSLRCQLCVLAVYIALDLPKALAEIV